MRDNFEQALSAILKHEGGYVDHPSDPGGATNMGITRKTLARWRKVAPWTALPKSAVKALSRDEAAEIYRATYWNEIRGDDLPSGVDYAVFDFAVNSGPARAAIYLQNIVKVAPDGQIGPLTIKAVLADDPKEVINDLCDERVDFLKRLSTFPTFGKGWMSRVAGVRKLALEMVSAKTPAKPSDPSKPTPSPSPPAPSLWDRITQALRGLFS